MAYNFNHQTNLKKPDENEMMKHIPPGRYIDIDDRYYSNKNANLNHQPETFGFMGKALKPHGENVNYQPTELVQNAGGLDQLKVNYNSYIYNQITGWDAHHPN